VRRLLVVGAVIALVVVVAAPSAAANPLGGGGGGGSTSDVTYAEASGCRMYASSYGYGIFCPTSGGITAKELLRGERAPTCWHVWPYAGWEPPEEILDPRQGTWRLKTCLTGFDEEGNATGPPQFSFEYVFVPGGQEITLTEAQENFVAFINDDRKLPLPVVAVSPVAAPRVGNLVAFFIVEGAPGETSIPEVNGVQMRARQVRLDVVPEAGEFTTCPGKGIRVEATDTRATRPDACWHMYRRSSAGFGDSLRPDRYLVRATAVWQIEYSTNDGATWQLLREVEKTALTALRVTEVQTLVIR
jgi:hypothetical protein